MDRYTKIVLTIIAAALCAIVVRNEIPTATAFGQSACGGEIGMGRLTRPCHLVVTIKAHGKGDDRIATTTGEFDELLRHVGQSERAGGLICVQIYFLAVEGECCYCGLRNFTHRIRRRIPI